MEDKVNLKNLILEVSNREKFNSLLLEKDYFLTKFLIELSNNKIDNLIFKGGTCLNKCYLGFYRLSEDLDFIFNEDLNNLTNRALKLKSEKIRSEINKLCLKCGLVVSDELGKGWKIITQNGRIINLVVYAKYKSLLSEDLQQIKIDVSFRHKLYLDTKIKTINHLFYDKLNDAILDDVSKIECIDIRENLSEKYRALVTRPFLALRDIFDIGYILSKDLVKIDPLFLDLVLLKINESLEYNKNAFKIDDFFKYISKLELNNVNLSSLEVVLRSDLILKDVLDKYLYLLKKSILIK
ncbi:MAG: nucleotidyl transferase AbiEii/AbiGii toxin family protein [Candidatus ainarchaeum sp.]|nr:nucleotidyl transferase AbiEii/AbiGii toxin family protein [Candidatus ainarchaeum sp.]MDD3975716.1 nucleotidyl transferase AbiEii/AbiGii toxin family protein [Candidatus ainarchaeum sp.]